MRFLLVFIMAAVLTAPQQQFPKDPLKDMQKRAEKEASERNYKDLKDAAAELAELSRQIRSEIDEGGKDVISARIFERLDKIEKLTKRIRDKAKGNAASIPKIN
jgi:type VI protein secretion system component VasF